MFLFTGFGLFGDIQYNPSIDYAIRLAEEWNGDHLTLTVDEAGLDVARQRIATRSYRFIVHLGLQQHGPAKLRVETRARNSLSGVPIDPNSPIDAFIETDVDMQPVIRHVIPKHPSMIDISHDAGDYYCNCLYYRTLRQLQGTHPQIQCLFVHVPSLQSLSLEDGLRVLNDLIGVVGRRC